MKKASLHQQTAFVESSPSLGSRKQSLFSYSTIASLLADG
jgi:hypothetical protein